MGKGARQRALDRPACDTKAMRCVFDTHVFEYPQADDGALLGRQRAKQSKYPGLGLYFVKGAVNIRPLGDGICEALRSPIASPSAVDRSIHQGATQV